jgi:aspartate-semialdehyde dehydrogenase
LEYYKVAVLGASGLVGREMIKILEERKFPVKDLKLLASHRSAGKKITFKGHKITVRECTEKSFKDVDLALFSAGSKAGRYYGEIAAREGTIVIDNSKAFRMDDEVPLVVPEVNAEALTKHNGIIANPNCSTIQLVIALKPIYDEVGLKRIIVSTYQAVSGTGKDAVQELMEQSEAILSSSGFRPEVYPHQIAFNVLPHIDKFLENGYSREEMKIVLETKKILSDQQLQISCTAVRVPVILGHSESVYLETKQNLKTTRLIQLLNAAPGVKVIDDLQNNLYPLPVMCKFGDEVLVGRIRKDLDIDNGLHLWIVGDNLRKGAALNAVQIAEQVIRNFKKE